MKKYSWKHSYFDADVQKVGEELEDIEQIQTISNKNVLNYAKKNKNSELHKCFEWDDTIAGEKWRLRQATELISSISFVVEEEPMQKQKVYYSIKTNEKEPSEFKNIRNILEDDDEYTSLCKKASDELERCKEKYYNLIAKEDLKEIIFKIYKDI